MPIEPDPPMIWPLDATAMFLPFLNEMLHDLGLWAIVPTLLFGGACELVRKFRAREAEIAALRREVADLQEKRLKDAKEMIRIIETGTHATELRTQSEQRFADTLEAVLRRHMRPGLFPWRR